MDDKLNFEGYPFRNEPPSGWVVLSLGELIESIRSGFASGRHNSEGDGIPHLRPMNINIRGENDFSEIRYVSPDVNPLRSQKGDILFNNTNSVALVGKTTVIKEESEYAFSNHMTRIKTNDQFICSEFIAKQLHYIFASGYFQLHCKRHVNQASISTEFLENSVPLLIPPLNEQKRILDRIEELQARSRRAREALETVPDLLEQLRQSLLASAFRGDLTKEWRKNNPDVEPASELLRHIRAERRKRWEKAELEKLKAKGLIGEEVDEEFSKRRKQYKEPSPLDTTELPELPESWCWVSLGQLVSSISYGTAKKCTYESTGVGVLRIPNILPDGVVSLADLKKATFSPIELDQYSLMKTDILLIRSNGSIGLVGRAAIVGNQASGLAFAGYLVRLRPLSFVDSSWLQMALTTPSMRSRIEMTARSTSGVNNINSVEISQLPIPLSPIAEQTEIETTVNRQLAHIRDTRYKHMELLENVTKLHQSILARAFRGELVSQDPNDEHASVLLERIRTRGRKQAQKTNIKTKRRPR